MATDQFWEVVEAAALTATETGGLDGHQARQIAAIEAALRQRSPDDVVAFQSSLDRHVERAITTPGIAEVAAVVADGISDDGLEYFAAWLVSFGETRFEEVLAEPAKVADILESGVEDVFFEEILTIAEVVYESMTKTRYPRPPKRRALISPRLDRKLDIQELRKKYPALWDRFHGN